MLPISHETTASPPKSQTQSIKKNVIDFCFYLSFSFEFLLLMKNVRMRVRDVRIRGLGLGELGGHLVKLGLPII